MRWEGFTRPCHGQSADSGEMGVGIEGRIESQIGGAKEKQTERQVEQNFVVQQVKPAGRASLTAVAVGTRSSPEAPAASADGCGQSSRWGRHPTSTDSIGPRSERVFHCRRGPCHSDDAIMERRSRESNNSWRSVRFFQARRNSADETHGLR